MSNNELTAREKETTAYLEAGVADVTNKGRADTWVRNAIANRKHYKQGNPPLAGLAVFVVAAGPSLQKNVHELKNVSRRGAILCVEAAYRFLLDNDVVPEYCITIDGDDRMLRMIEGADTSKTTLIAMASASPKLVEAWQGPKFFTRCLGGAKDVDDRLIAAAREVIVKRDLKAGEVLNGLEDVEVVFPGLGVRMITGGNVTGAAHSFAFESLRATKVIFVGADYAWTDPDQFYAGGAHKEMGHERQNGEEVFSHKTPEGDVATNFSMFSFKRWHEEYAVAAGHTCVNATEGGILGVNREGETAEGWEQLTLAEAVARYAPK